tara:strand:+ start:314 stop:598 length:285 start_codon:yes stop_codon:yes gene_type:complete
MKKLLTFLIPLFFFISCEDEAQDATACADTLANMEANMEVATTKLENEPNKTNCDAIVKLYQEIYDCMPAGSEKDEMKENLETLKSSCSLLFGS